MNNQIIYKLRILIILAIGSLLQIPVNAQFQCSLNLGNDTILCGSQMTLDAGSGFYTYEWSTGATSQTITVSNFGAYQVTVTEIGPNVIYNGDFELGNVGFICDYTYNPSSLWLEGTYWVGSNPNLVHPNFFNYPDHTPAPGVNYLICNGSAIAGSVVWEQSVNVTPNTDYIFSAWVSSLVVDNPAQLQFRVNNVLVGGVFVAPNQVNSWIQYYEIWNSGGSTTADISIINQNVATGGNDFGLDDIYFAPVVPCSDTIYVNQPNMVADITGTDIACFGESTGTADLEVTNGYTPFQYLWSTGNNYEDLNNIPAGTYSVTVTDKIGCTAEADVTLYEPSSALVIASESFNVSCAGANDGKVDQIVTGGVAPYDFSWDNGSSGEDLLNVPGGSYNMTVIDDAGCERTAVYLITEPDPLEIILAGEDLSCYGDTDGFISTQVSGGIQDYLFTWNSGHSVPSITNLGAGTYTLTVTDFNGCTESETITIDEPAKIQLYASSDKTICLGQSASIVTNAVGGITPYVYYWSPGGFPANVANVNPSETTEYCVYIKDFNHCVSNKLCRVINVHPPLDLEINISEDSICKGDTITLRSLASGGNGGPYVYELGTGQVIDIVEELTPDHTGKIIVVANDACGTPAVRDTLNIVVSDPPVVSFESDVLSGCPPLKVNFTNHYSDPDYNFLWDFQDGAYFNTSVEEHPTHEFRNSGIYDINLTISNKLGCSAEFTHFGLIEVYEKPVANIGVENPVASIANPVFHFENYTTGASDYYWQFGNGDSVIAKYPIAQYYPFEGDYLVSMVAENIHGCRDTAYITVSVEGVQTTYFPNAINPFSHYPENKEFKPIGNFFGTDDYYMAIYTRWGSLVFESSSIDMGWNGKNEEGNLMPNGTYIWIIQYRDIKDNLVQETGTLNLVY